MKKTYKRYWTDEKINKLKEMNETESMATMIKYFSCSMNSIRNVLCNNGLKRPKHLHRYVGRLTEEMARDIKRMLASGETTSAIQKKYKISCASISCIRNGKSWKEITI